MESTTTTWKPWSQNRPTGEQFQVTELDDTLKPFGDDLTEATTFEEAKADARALARKNRSGAFGVVDAMGRIWGIA
jgi:hypothetical protein